LNTLRPKEPNLDRIITGNRGAAEFIGMSEGSVKRLRALEQFPHPRKIGLRLLGWQVRDLIEWVKSREVA
jgi:predicted DNA-binding transcriptional regulator AlpA